MPTVMEEIEKMQAKAVNDMHSNKAEKKERGKNTLERTIYEKNIVPHLVDGVRVKLKTDDEYTQTINGYDLASGELCTDIISKRHERARYGTVVGEPSLPAPYSGCGCIVVAVIIDSNIHPIEIDINGVELTEPQKMAA